MDDASRGAFGAVKALATWTGGLLTALGSAIMILLIAFGPFLQQLVEYPTHDVEWEQSGDRVGATIPRSLNFTVQHSDNPAISDNDLETAIDAGLTFDPEVWNVRATCPTAHCSWKPFKSIGWCSKCEDVTNSTIVQDCNVGALFPADPTRPFCNVTLPFENPSMEYTWDSIALATPSAGFDGATDVQYITEVIWDMRNGPQGSLKANFFEINGISNPLVTFAYVAMEPVGQLTYGIDRHSTPVRLKAASRCVLTLCEREYNATTTDGITNITVLSTNYGVLTTPYIPDINTVGRGLLCWQPDAGYFNITSLDENDTWLDQESHAFCQVGNYASRFADMLVLNSSVSWHLDDPFYNSGNRSMAPLRFQNISAQFERVAAALTSYGLTVSNSTHSGTAYVPVTYVRVRWWWIIFPIVLELATTILLLLTIFQSHRVDAPLWKSSALAMYYHRVGDPEPISDPTAKLSGMDVAAQNTSVRLHVIDGKGAFSLSAEKREPYKSSQEM